MGMVLKVGEPSRDISQRPPKNWPTCGDFWFAQSPRKPSEREISSCKQLLYEATGGSRVPSAITFTLTVAILNFISNFI
jgi:hypothetical protein